MIGPHLRKAVLRNATGTSCAVLLFGLFLLTGCGGSDTAEEELSTAEYQRQNAPPRARKLLLSANRAYEDEQYHRALALVDSAEKLAPAFADVPFMRGRILTDLRQFEDAQAAYDRVEQLAPDYEGLRFNMANNAFRQGRFERAVRLYRRALERGGIKTAQAHLNLGRSYANLSKPDSARLSFREVLELDGAAASDRARAHYRLSQLHETSGQIEDALRHARQALELNEEQSTYRYQVGAVLFQLNQYEDAVGHLRAVVQAEPANQSAHYTLGQALARLGRQEDARRYLARSDSLEQLNAKIRKSQRAAYQNPSNVMAWVKYGDVLRQVGRPADAIDAYQIALNLTPGNLPLMDHIANLHMATGDTTEAIRRYRAILQRDSTMARTWLNLGVAYAQTGRIDSAKRAMEQAIRHRPDYRRAEQYLAQLNKISS